jgi:hypothetical protein
MRSDPLGFLAGAKTAPRRISERQCHAGRDALAMKQLVRKAGLGLT